MVVRQRTKKGTVSSRYLKAARQEAQKRHETAAKTSGGSDKWYPGKHLKKWWNKKFKHKAQPKQAQSPQPKQKKNKKKPYGKPVIKRTTGGIGPGYRRPDSKRIDYSKPYTVTPIYNTKKITPPHAKPKPKKKKK